jgi:hypothetical protein
MAPRALLVAREVGNPHISLLVDVDAVRRHHHPFAEVRQHLAAVAVELEDGINRVVLTVHRTAAGSPGAAAFVAPDVSVLRIDVETGRRAPLPAGGKLTPIAGDLRCRIRQPLAGNRIRHLRGALRRRQRRAGAGVAVGDQQKNGAGGQSGDQDSRRGHGTSSWLNENDSAFLNGGCTAAWPRAKRPRGRRHTPSVELVLSNNSIEPNVLGAQAYHMRGCGQPRRSPVRFRVSSR